MNQHTTHCLVPLIGRLSLKQDIILGHTIHIVPSLSFVNTLKNILQCLEIGIEVIHTKLQPRKQPSKKTINSPLLLTISAYLFVRSVP